MSTEAGIFGSSYTFEGDDSEHIRALADYVDRKMSETAKRIRNVTTSKVAIMTAMTIADELFRLRESVEQADADNAARLDNLIAMSRDLGAPAQGTSKASSLPHAEEHHAQ